MAAITFDGNDDPRFHQPADDPAPTPAPAPVETPFTRPDRPEGGRDDNGNYVPNPRLPGAPDYYWDGDQQIPIPHGTPTPTNNNTGGNSGGNGNAWDSAAAERAIRDQYQRLGNRAPSAQELATDLEAARRYGLTNPNGPTGGTLGQIAARFNNTPGSGVTGNPFAGWSNPNDPRTLQTQTANTHPTPNVPNRPNTSPTFDDPTQRLVEDSALHRMQQLNNPDPNSGTALYESYLKQLADTLKGAPFSDTEMAQLKNSVYQDLLSERDATQKRWLETVSQRGLAPSSGPALEGLKQIDGHFEQIRSAADSQFALAAIQQRQSNQSQVASIYGGLAASEEGRLDKGFTYSQVPYGLTNDAFQRNLQLVGAAGSPGGTINSVLGIVNAINANNQINSQNRTALTSGLLQYLGYLYPNGVGA